MWKQSIQIHSGIYFQTTLSRCYDKISVCFYSKSLFSQPTSIHREDRVWPGRDIIMGPWPVVTSYNQVSTYLRPALSTTLSPLECNREVTEVLTK